MSKTEQVVNVFPIGDTKPHDLPDEFEEWEQVCHCNPLIDGRVIVHNAYDGREALEQAEAIVGNATASKDGYAGDKWMVRGWPGSQKEKP